MATPALVPRPVRKIPNIRWWIAGLLFVSTVINCMDRQNLSILARTVLNELRISDTGYSWVVQLLLLADTIGYILAGRLTEWLGTRASVALFTVWWSMSDMLTSLAFCVSPLCLCALVPLC